MSILRTFKFISNHPLNKGKKIKSLMTFVKWQIGSRLLSCPVVYNWVNQSKFLVKNGETGLTMNIYTGLHEFSDMGFLLHYLQPNDTFVDVGANSGSYTILASAGIGAKTIAFEPTPQTYTRLISNIKLNNIEKKVDCINKGVGDALGEIFFTSENDTMNHVVSKDEDCKNKILIEVTTLDKSLETIEPVLMKIDVEGYETPVLKGAGSILSKKSLNCIIMELNGNANRYGFDESQILQYMLSFGFKTYSYDPFTRKLINLDGKNLSSGNTLFIKNLEFVEERLKKAPKFNIKNKEI